MKESESNDFEHGDAIPASRVLEEGSVEDEDAARLRAMGYLPQMKRKFSLISLIGCSFSVTNSWLAVCGGFTTGVSIGGAACIVYGLIIVAFFNIFIGISLSELISAFPNAGGQYYWALKLAPPRYARVSAYVTGVCNVAGALCAGASTSIAVAYLVMGCVKIVHTDLTLHSWQIYLVAVGFNAFIGMFNFSQKLVPKITNLGLWLSLVSFIVIIITIPTSSPSHTDVSFVFTSMQNQSGWSSKGMAFLVGMINANYAFGLLDTTTHLAEEIIAPERNIPKAIMLTVGMGFGSAFAMACVLMYCLTDYDTVVGTDTGVPLLQLFYMALRNNKAAAIALTSLVILCYTTSQIALHTYISRVFWSFSRDKGLPFSSTWALVDEKLGMPIYSHLLSIALITIICLLSVASTTAFNSMIAGVIIFPYLSYILPVVYSMSSRNTVKGPFHTGRYSVVSKVGTLVFCLFTTIIYSFPYIMPATAADMNYISVFLAFVALYGIVDWTFRAKHQFRAECRDRIVDVTEHKKL